MTLNPMAFRHSEMNQFEETCRPILFEHDDPEFSYWGKGSSFLVANSNGFFWVTASHVLANTGGCAQSLRIFPSDHSKVSLPFNEKFTIRTGLTDDKDYKDLFVLRVDLKEFDDSGDTPLVAQNIDQGVLPAEDLVPGDELWVIGYPAESNYVDYEIGAIKNTRSVIRGIYRGRSIFDHCHELKIDSSIMLDSYDGLSGSPVFSRRPKNPGMAGVVYPLLVGMLLRGTASSQVAHFVSSRDLVDLINIAENNV